MWVVLNMTTNGDVSNGQVEAEMTNMRLLEAKNIVIGSGGENVK
jgi:hypothetical protein